MSTFDIGLLIFVAFLSVCSISLQVYPDIIKKRKISNDKPEPEKPSLVSIEALKSSHQTVSGKEMFIIDLRIRNGTIRNRIEEDYNIKVEYPSYWNLEPVSFRYGIGEPDDVYLEGGHGPLVGCTRTNIFQTSIPFNLEPDEITTKYLWLKAGNIPQTDYAEIEILLNDVGKPYTIKYRLQF